jgi:DNA-binding response OmpR family regulator
MKVLIAEDDPALVLFLTRGFEADGHRVRSASDGAGALQAFRSELPDLTILDLNLPVIDGEQVLAAMHATDPQLPVLILTGRQEVETRIRCLDLGADDLMLKPFSLHELRARCRVLLRRRRQANLMMRVGDLELDRLEHTARRSGEAIALTNKEFALLEHLMLNRGQCVSRVELLDAVWNMEPAQTTNNAGTDIEGDNGNAGNIFNAPTKVAGSAAALTVALSDPGKIAAAGLDLGTGDGSNAVAAASLATQGFISGQTPSNFYSNLVSTLGATVSETTTTNTALTASVTQLQSQVSSLSGVSLDDEASSLEEFQRSYQAASQVFTILNSIMASALNLGVETAVA